MDVSPSVRMSISIDIFAFLRECCTILALASVVTLLLSDYVGVIPLTVPRLLLS
jgi:hypothetical protein